MGSEKRIGVVILAAGSSSRLGKPKQLIMFNGKPLLQHAIDACETANLDPCILILGAHADSVVKRIELKSFKVEHNKNWQEGMASSIRLGAEVVIESANRLDALMILLSDQPFVEKELLVKMIELFDPGQEQIIACEYKNVLGVPIIFDQTYLPELLALKGDTGARKVVNKYREKVKVVNFESGALDIDTPDDVNLLKEWENGSNG